jgi:hypothetical protein
VAAAPHCHGEASGAGELDGPRHVRPIGAAGDGGRTAIDRRVPDGARLVVAFVPWEQEDAAKVGAQA